jgi:hypothetical protein
VTTQEFGGHENAKEIIVAQVGNTIAVGKPDRLVVVMGRDFISALQPGGFLYYPRMKANVTE